MGENEDVHRRDPASLGDETTIYLETDGNAVKSLYAIVEVSNGWRVHRRHCYRTIDEARSAWPGTCAENRIT